MSSYCCKGMSLHVYNLRREKHRITNIVSIKHDIYLRWNSLFINCMKVSKAKALRNIPQDDPVQINKLSIPRISSFEVAPPLAFSNVTLFPLYIHGLRFTLSDTITIKNIDFILTKKSLSAYISFVIKTDFKQIKKLFNSAWKSSQKRPHLCITAFNFLPSTIPTSRPMNLLQRSYTNVFWYTHRHTKFQATQFKKCKTLNSNTFDTRA